MRLDPGPIGPDSIDGAREPADEQSPPFDAAAAIRLRLLELHTATGSAFFGGGFCCVLTDPGPAAPVATWIADALIGPRPDGVDGEVYIGTRPVPIHQLPEALLRPSEPRVVDADLLRELWLDDCEARRADVEAAHAARRLERHRSEAALEASRERMREREAAAPATRDGGAAEAGGDEDEDAEDRTGARLSLTLAALRDLPLVPSPEAQSLADEFDRLAARTGRGEAAAADLDLVAAEKRFAAARLAAAQLSGPVADEARAEIERRHRAVVEAESALFDARRRERRAALERYEQAVASEQEALRHTGVDSYASYLVAVARGAQPIAVADRLRVELELAEAQAGLVRAREAQLTARPAADTRTREEIEIELRARAAQVLGRFAGPDPASELRAVRVEHPDAAGLRIQLADELTVAGVDPGSDPESAALDALRIRPWRTTASAAPATPAASPQPALDASEELLALQAERVRLLQECEEHDRALEVLQRELEHIDRERASDLGALHAATFCALVDGVFGLYGRGELLAGRLPVIFSGAFDALDADVVGRAASHLVAAAGAQVIVVTCEPRVAEIMAGGGAQMVTWIDSSGARPERAPDRSSGAKLLTRHTRVACARHPNRTARAQCAHCERHSCLLCLVYVPSESELWCSDCVDGMYARNGRASRRGRAPLGA